MRFDSSVKKFANEVSQNIGFLVLSKEFRAQPRTKKFLFLEIERTLKMLHVRNH